MVLTRILRFDGFGNSWQQPSVPPSCVGSLKKPKQSYLGFAATRSKTMSQSQSQSLSLSLSLSLSQNLRQTMELSKNRSARRSMTLPLL